MRVIRKLTVAALVTAASSLFLGLSEARAQEQAAAEALFQEGRHLMQEGKFAEACPKLVDSNKLDPAVGTLLYLGECYEKNGQTASAWATFQAAADAAHKEGQKDRAKIATDRANALFGKLSKISIMVAEAALVPGLEIKRDGVDVGQATWGVGVPLDPGEHVVVAKAPGKKDWSQTVKIEAGGTVATVDIPALEDAAIAPPQLAAAAPGPNQPQATSSPIDQGTSRHHGNTQRALAFVSGGVGVLGLLTGTVFGLEAKHKENQSQSHCLTSDPTACFDNTGLSLRSIGHTDATVANVGFVVGALGLIGGGALYFTAPHPAPTQAASADTQRSAPRVAITPVIGTQSSSLLVTGSF